MQVGALLNGLVADAAKNPVLLISLLLGIGSALGAIRLRNFSLGPAAVLFLALALSAANPTLVLPAIVGNVGLALFAYTIGVTAGPSFFASLKKGSAMIGFTAAALIMAAALTAGLGIWLSIPKEIMAGVFAGSLTNTPALAAASEQVGGQGPIVGYSITYIFGVIGMLIVATIAVRRGPAQGADSPALTTRNVRVEAADLPDIGTLSARYDHSVVFSRLSHGDAPGHSGKVAIATEHDVPVTGDILTIVGPPAALDQVISDLGHASTVALQMDREFLDFRRVTISNSKLSGRRVDELDLERSFGATVTRVRRGDVDLLATDELVVLTGDRLRIVAPRDNLSAVSAFFGDSEASTSHLDAASLGIGMSLGILLGLLVWPLPGGTDFALGVAGGSLIVGLVLGRAMRTGPFVWTLPYGTSNILSQLGLLLFLAYAGSIAGPAFLGALDSDELPAIVFAGFVVTTTFTVAILAFGWWVAHLDRASLAGAIAGSGTQPAVLAHANSLISSSKVNLGYALVYPIAMILKVILAPLIGTLL